MRTAALLALLLTAAPCAAVETLQQMWRLADARNPGMAASRLQAEALLSDSRAASASLAPSASVRTGYTVRNDQPSIVVSQPGLGYPAFRLPSAQQQAASLSARASIPLWTAGRLENSVAASQARHNAACEAADWDEMRLRLAVTEAYLAVIQANASCDAAAGLLRSNESKAEDTQQRVVQRRATDQEVLEARVAVLEARQQLVRAENSRRNSIATLNQLLGRPLGQPCNLVEPFFTPLHESLAQLTDWAQANRPDVIEILHRIRMHEHDSRTRRAASKPQVSAQVGMDYEENRFQSPQGLASAGIYVDWTAFDAGCSRLQSDSAGKLAAAMRAELRERQNLVALELLKGWNERSEACNAEQLAAEALKLAQERHRSLESRFQQGIAVQADLQVTEARLVEARAQMVYARTDRIVSQARLRLVAGRLGPE